MSRIVALLLVLWSLAAAPARAEVVPDLYAATVPVTDQGAAALEAGARAALAEVLVKVSGSEEALRHPAVAEALRTARSQVQQYGFGRDPAVEGGLTARFEFDSGYVTRLLTSEGLPLGTANRPRVLVWVVVELDGERRFINPAETPELAGQLMQAFRRRGVPAQFPLFDLDDATAISVEDVWEQRAAAVEAASARYAREDVLMGRVVEVSGGQWVGDWSFLHAGERRDRSSDAPAMAEFFQGGVNLVAEDMVARYAVAAGGTQESRIRMGVSGVTRFADYASLVNWLESLELVDEASVDRISGDRLELVLAAATDASRLAQIIELNPHLQAVDTAAQTLEYQWLD